MTTIQTLDTIAVRTALAVRDLTDPEQGPHAMQRLLAEIESALARRLHPNVVRRRTSPVVPVVDNYDRLGYPPEATARDARYSRYLTPQLMLRAHTTAALPQLLEELAVRNDDPDDVVLTVPGLVYRRDAIDRHHVGEPHQIDVWRIRRHERTLDTRALDELVDAMVTGAVPGHRWRTQPRTHPYTVEGRQVDVLTDGGWLEVGECGLAAPGLLASTGLASGSGLASGWGLDRLLMIRKGIDDIRVLRSSDPRVARQLLDLAPYQPVSSLPLAIRDISVAMTEPVDVEVLGDRIRTAIGVQAEVVEDVRILADTPGDQLPEAARARLGMRPGQRNLLIRLVLRPVARTLTSTEANALRDRIYAALHEGDAHQWAGTRSST